MVNVLQQGTGDEADHKPESRFEDGFESGRHESNHDTGCIPKRGHDTNIPTVGSTVSFRPSLSSPARTIKWQRYERFLRLP